MSFFLELIRKRLGTHRFSNQFYLENDSHIFFIEVLKVKLVQGSRGTLKLFISKKIFTTNKFLLYKTIGINLLQFAVISLCFHFSFQKIELQTVACLFTQVIINRNHESINFYVTLLNLRHFLVYCALVSVPARHTFLCAALEFLINQINCNFSQKLNNEKYFSV